MTVDIRLYDTPMKKQDPSQLVLFLLKNFDTNHCPPKKFLLVDEKELIVMTAENKCVPCLFHLIDCQNCQKYFSQNFKTAVKKHRRDSITTSLWYEQQKNEISRALKQQRISFYFLKDFSPYKKITYHQRYFWSTDLDVLVSLNNFSQAKKILSQAGYQKIRVRRHETAFRKKRGVEIDLHSLAANYDADFHLLAHQDLKQLTTMLLDKPQLKKNHPNKEIFLLFLITHFWVNDCLKRIRTLYDIAEFTKHYRRDIDWQKLVTAAQKIHFLKQTVFVLYLCSQQFSITLPRQIRLLKQGIIFSALLRHHSSERIMHFPQTKQWWKPTNQISQQMHEECFLTALLLKQTNVMKVLYKPRLLRFLCKILFGF